MPEDPRTDYDIVATDITSASTAVCGQMFGTPCLKENGKAFAAFHKHNGAMVFKLRGEAHAEALALQGAGLFDPSGRGRPMKEWVEVPHEHASLWPDLCRAALAYINT